MNEKRGTMGRTGGEAMTQSEKEAKITEIFRSQFKGLAALFPKDGAVLVARARQCAIMACREIDKKTGKPRLAAASAESIAEKSIAAHHLGLEVGTEAYLVPYANEVQLIIGPRGLIKLMYRSGQVRAVESESVYDGDTFDYTLGDEPSIRHKLGQDRHAKQLTHVWIVVTMREGGKVRKVLTREDLEYYRSKSKQSNGPMWTENYDGAARKTIIHRVAEFIPMDAITTAALREGEEGSVEIPEEIMAAVRGKMAAQQQGPAGKAAIPTDAEIQGRVLEALAEAETTTDIDTARDSLIDWLESSKVPENPTGRAALAAFDAQVKALLAVPAAAAAEPEKAAR